MAAYSQLSMMYFLSLVYFACIQINAADDTVKYNVILVGLFAHNTSDIILYDHLAEVANGQIVQEAVLLALEDIEKSTDIRVNLELRPFDTQCDPARNGWAIAKTLRDTQAMEPLVILGPPCDDSANYLVPMTSRFTKIITLGYAARTPRVDNNTLFKSFFRTVSSVTDLNAVLNSILLEFGWRHICLVLESDSTFYLTVAESLTNIFEHINVLETYSLSNLKYISERTFCRIFVVMAKTEHLPDIYCEALKKGLVGHLYQWIVYGDSKVQEILHNQHVPVDLTCNKQELLQSMQSSFILTFDANVYHRVQVQADNVVNPYDNSSDFEMELKLRLQNTSWFDSTKTNITSNDLLTSASAYDATWAIALALNASIKHLSSNGLTIRDYLPLSNSGIAHEIIINQFESLDFVGISNKIEFSSLHHDTKSFVKVLQVQDGQNLVPVGLYYDSLNLTYFGSDPKWLGNGPPNDQPVTKYDSVPLYLQVMTFLLSGFGCAVMITFIIVNYVFKERNVIKASSPHINTLILLGCLLGFVSAVMYTISSITSVNNFGRTFSCNGTIWTISLMFTLSFGSLFAKTWRVYAVFRNPWSKRRIYKDYMLLSIVLIMVCVDVIILTGWMIASPLYIDTRQLYTPDVTTTVSYCGIENEGVYCGVILIAYKCLLLLFGCFLAVQTRKIKAKAFNDSKYIAIAIYGVFIVVIVGLPLAVFMLLGFNVLLSFLSIILMILGLSFIVSCTVFTPKLYLLYVTRNEKALNPLTTTRRQLTTVNRLHRESTKITILKNPYTQRESKITISSHNPHTDCELKKTFGNLKQVDEVEKSMYKGLHEDCV